MEYSRTRVIRGGDRVSDLVSDTPVLLLMLEHFGILEPLGDKSVSKLCNDYEIDIDLFCEIANMFRGQMPSGKSRYPFETLEALLTYLKNNHHYYLSEKLPYVREQIETLESECELPEIPLIKRFFEEYSNEVKEHLLYEDSTAFPYFRSLIEGVEGDNIFSVREYRDHHSDIETKLADLKNLLIKHVDIKSHYAIRRNLLVSLFELEQDLRIHSIIEEKILMPLIRKRERELWRDE